MPKERLLPEQQRLLNAQQSRNAVRQRYWWHMTWLPFFSVH